MEEILDLEQNFTLFQTSFSSIKTNGELIKLKNEFLGKESVVRKIMKTLPLLQKEKRITIGSKINYYISEIEKKIKSFRERKYYEDPSFPIANKTGFIHPISFTIEKVKSILISNKIEFFDGPEQETIERNFDLLNVDENHPIREDHQSFFLKDGKMLRTHTSSVQAYILSTAKVGKFFTIGKTYRKDHDKTHLPMFHQLEILFVGGDQNVKTMMSFIKSFLFTFFEYEVELRWRPSFFPFTHFSMEVDILWKGKLLELLGCGIIHRNLFKLHNVNFQYSFALGMGIERLYMIKYGVTDIRDLYSSNLNKISSLGRKSFFQ